MIVGSRAFFEGIEGFESKDTDVLILEKNPSLYQFYMQKSQNNTDTFYWNIDKILEYDYNRTPMAVGKFLIPEVLKALSLEFKDVVILLEEFIPKLDKRHNYQKHIFEFYKESKEMKLTDEQTIIIYKKYKEWDIQ